MGACAGKPNRPAVVTVKNRPNKNANPSLAEHQTAFEEYDDHPKNTQENRPISQQKPQDPQPPIQHTDSQPQYSPPQDHQTQYVPQEKQSISPTTHIEKKRESQAINDIDEEEFASQFHKKESPQGHNKANVVPVYQQNDNFAMNISEGQGVHHEQRNIGHKVEETKTYQNKNIDKRVRDIINNPDDLEHSLSSPVKKLAEKKDDDDFDDFINNKPTNDVNHIEHHHRQSNLSNGSYGLIGEQNNRGMGIKIESASPMSGLIHNSTAVEKQKPIEVQSSERKEYIESPEIVRNVKEESPMKMRESMESKKQSPEKLNMKRKSLEKMPWERTSGAHDDENEIEFFDDELEAS